jgi:Uma2 family endonuclease
VIEGAAMQMGSAEHVTRRPTPAEAIALLRNGARMKQPRFHELYELTPPKFKAELIGGVVYVASALSFTLHGDAHARIMGWLYLYADRTLGIRQADNSTSILGEDSEPQPDAFLMILPEYGGLVRIDERGYVHKAPELIIEVAHSTAPVDLKSKKDAYFSAGVNEYVVVLPDEQYVRWFVHKAGGFRDMDCGKDGLFRSIAFPGLWLNPEGLFSETTRRLSAGIKKGLSSPEHAAFVAKLKDRHARYLAKKRKGK